jgi:hypothetical protein
MKMSVISSVAKKSFSYSCVITTELPSEAETVTTSSSAYEYEYDSDLGMHFTTTTTAIAHAIAPATEQTTISAVPKPERESLGTPSVGVCVPEAWAVVESRDTESDINEIWLSDESDSALEGEGFGVD